MSIVERALAKAAGIGRSKAAELPAVSPRPVAEPALPASSDPFWSDNSTVVDIHPEILRKAGLGLAPDMERLIAEELRVIKRPILLNAERDDQSLPNRNLVMIGSALPGAGKTFLSFNTALSMATELDWTVLLVDADVSRPTLTRGFGLGDARGLVDMLESESDSLSQCVVRTTHPKLFFLPAGVPRTQAKELLGSQRMRALTADLSARGQRSIVVFDSPPLLRTSEARVLASYVGQIMLVVEAGVTPRQSLLEAIELLDPQKAVTLVLNKNRQVFGSGDYHYAGYETYGSDANS